MEQFKYRDQREPEAIDAGRLRVTKEEFDDISLLVLLALDAAKRGEANNAMVNRLLEHVLTAYTLWTKTRNDVLMRRGYAGYLALQSACAKYPSKLRLAGTEYRDVRNVVSAYLRQMEFMRASDLVAAYRVALEKLGA
jgi:hypothetical protein